MISKSEWAALVYGRTYETDFRFIVTPDDFRTEEKNWAWNYIRATTRSPEKLPSKFRWSLFTNEQHCVFGVTCMVKDLMACGTDEISERMTQDSQQRPLYIFLGYVAKVNKQLSLPNCSNKNLALLQPLYNKYIRQKWEEKSYEVCQNNLTSSYQIDFDGILATEDTNSRRISPESLNFQDQQMLYLWQNSDNQNLWFAASQSQRSVSVCLDLASSKDILDSPFLNGTAFDVRDKQKIKRVQEVKNITIAKPKNTQSSISYEQILELASEDKGEDFPQSLLSKKFAEFNKDPRGFFVDEVKEAFQVIAENLLSETEEMPIQCGDPAPLDFGFKRKQQDKQSRNSDFHKFDKEINMNEVDDFDFLSELMLDLDNDGTLDVTQIVDIDGDGTPDMLLLPSHLDSDIISTLNLDEYGTIDNIDIADISISSNADTICDLDNWHQQSYNDTCAIVSQEFMLEELTGKDFSEENLRQEAIDKGYYISGGGTSLENMGKLIEEYGFEVERTYDNTLEELNSKLEQGQKVMVALDSDEIWTPGQDKYQDDYVNDYVQGYGLMPGQAADHAVQVVDIDDSDPNNPMVILKDPGNPDGDGMRVPADEFVDAWADSNHYMVVATNNVIDNSNPQLAQQIDTQERSNPDFERRIGAAGNCWSCSGSGVTWSANGNVKCWSCGGSGIGAR